MAADEEGFFEDWPKWTKPVFALSAMILLGGVWIGIPLLMAWKLGYNNAQAAVPMDYDPMMAVLIAMTTVTITGIFVFMTFRIDRGTRLKAERVAKEKINELVNDKLEQFERDAKTKLDLFAIDTKRQLDQLAEKSKEELDQLTKNSKEKLDAFDGTAKGKLDKFDETSKDKFNKLEKSAKTTLGKLETKVDDSTTPDVIRKEIERRIPEDTLRAHIDAVFLANANEQIVRAYAERRADAMEAEDIDSLLRLLGDVIEHVARHAGEEPAEDDSGPSGGAAMATWWHRLVNRRD